MKIYSDTTAADGTRRVSLLGIRIYKKWQAAGAVKRAWFQVLFKSVRRAYVVRYYLLGIRVYRKKDFFNLLKDTNVKLNSLRKDTGARLSAMQKDLPAKIRTTAMEETRNALIVARQHQKVFPRFKNIHHGQSVVIVGSGPTLNRYVPIPGAIHIALNRNIFYDKVKFDYFFATDYLSFKDYQKKIINCSCIKFYGRNTAYGPHSVTVIPEYLTEENDNVFEFYNCGDFLFDHGNICKDISCSPLYSRKTVAHCALHFALWTHPQRIYLVGCDCALLLNQFYYDNAEPRNPLEHYKNTGFPLMKYGYSKFKIFRDVYYPDVEIISVNPVGLKGMFRDIYTDAAGEYVAGDGSPVTLS